MINIDELKCPICISYYDDEKKVPLILIDCGHNVCKECFEGGLKVCPFDCKLLKAEKYPVNKIIINLLKVLKEKDAFNLKKEKPKTKFDIELITEYISTINEHYAIFKEEFQEVIQSKIVIEKKYCDCKEKLKKYFEELKKIIASYEDRISSGIKKDYFDYNKELISKMEKTDKEVKIKFEIWKKKIVAFFDVINKKLSKGETIQKDEKETENLIKDSENLLNEITKNNQRIKKISNLMRTISTDNNLTFPFPFEAVNSIISIKRPHQSSSNDNLLCLTSKIKGKSLPCTPRNTYSISDKCESSFTSSPEHFMTSYSTKTRGFDLDEHLTKDKIIFIKNKVKNEVINLSGYSIGDEGCRVMVKFLIRNSEKNKIIFKELKVAKSEITSKGLVFITVALNVTKNTITKLDLSNNDLSDDCFYSLSSLVKKNKQIKVIRLKENKFSEEFKEKFIMEFKNSNTVILL